MASGDSRREVSGWALFSPDMGNGVSWQVFEDDGHGNGEFVAEFAGEAEARAFVIRLRARPDESLAEALRELREAYATEWTGQARAIALARADAALAAHDSQLQP